jgi:hypothetical protein
MGDTNRSHAHIVLKTGEILFFVAMVWLSTACKREKIGSALLTQRAYVWQRDWNPPVADAIARSRGHLSGHVVLATEIEWLNRRPKTIVPAVDWSVFRNEKTSVSPAIRVMPYPGPFSEDDETIRLICETARQRLADMRSAGLEPRELQLDFDCAQKKLADYGKWVRTVRRAVSPVPLVITTLPAWLDEPEFPGLVRAASAYVLQVHSVAPPAGGQTVVCDPELARSRVARASRIGVPFEISLPTYRTIAGYDPEGKKIGAYSDAVRPAWPPGTTIREYATDLDAMASLVATWQTDRPPHCRGLIWYRLPVDGDRLNCPWPAFRALSSGRSPVRACAVSVNGMRPDDGKPVTLADLSLVNTGECDEVLLAGLSVKWEASAKLALAEPPSGWRMIREDLEATFIPPQPLVRLPIGERRAMGWLRFDQPARIHVDILPQTR